MLIDKNTTGNIIKVLVGNYCDCEDERKVSYEEGKKFAESNGMVFFEVSAKTGENVQESFECIFKEAIDINPAEKHFI